MSQPAPTSLNIAEEFVSRPAREHPQKLAILGGERELSYAQLENEVNRVAQALREFGCAPRDRVLIVLPDSAEFIASFFGAAKIGAIAVPVNSMAREGDYQHYVRDSSARFAIVHVETYGAFRLAAERSALERIVVVGSQVRVDPPHQGVAVRWEDWLPEAAGEIATAPTGAGRSGVFSVHVGQGRTGESGGPLPQRYAGDVPRVRARRAGPAA